MSRVPGYEQRLRALIFKGNFQEKVDEMKEVRLLVGVTISCFHNMIMACLVNIHVIEI